MQEHSHYRSPRREQREERLEKIFSEIIVENFPKGKETVT